MKVVGHKCKVAHRNIVHGLSACQNSPNSFVNKFACREWQIPLSAWSDWYSCV